jgi:hypothetical protein
MEVQSGKWKVQYDECGIVGCGTVGMESQKDKKEGLASTMVK